VAEPLRGERGDERAEGRGGPLSAVVCALHFGHLYSLCGSTLCCVRILYQFGGCAIILYVYAHTESILSVCVQRVHNDVWCIRVAAGGAAGRVARRRNTERTRRQQISSSSLLFLFFMHCYEYSVQI